MDNLKLYSKNERTLDSLIQTLTMFSENIECNLGLIHVGKEKGENSDMKSDGFELPYEKVMK